MASNGDLRVSSRGQMSFPAAARRRWRLEKGGRVGYLDLGDAVVILPGGLEKVRRKLLETITEEDWRVASEGFGDPDLANE